MPPPKNFSNGLRRSILHLFELCWICTFLGAVGCEFWFRSQFGVHLVSVSGEYCSVPERLGRLWRLRLKYKVLSDLLVFSNAVKQLSYFAESNPSLSAILPGMQRNSVLMLLRTARIAQFPGRR
jgi:hypothetical protein